MNNNRQQGMVLITGLLLLLAMTFIAITVSNQGLIQQKLAGQLDETSMAFVAAEAGVEAVIHEQENLNITDEMLRALNQARQASTLGGSLTPDEQAAALTDRRQRIGCFGNAASDAEVIVRTVDNTGLQLAGAHSSSAALSTVPPVDSWSHTVFIGQDNLLFKGGEAETLDAGFAFHAFLVRGCGQAANSPMAAATQLNVAVMGPKVE